VRAAHDLRWLADAEAAGPEARRGTRVYRGTHTLILDTTDGLSALSLDRLQKLYARHYIMPPMPPMPPWLWSD
jgi:hypothetical protein